MLIPRRVKHRKQHRPDRHGAAKGGTRVTFGEYGIQAVEPAYVTNRQIESARIAMTRHIRRGGKVWINDLPGPAADQEAGRDPDGFRQGRARVVGRQRQARPGHVRAVRRLRADVAREALRRAMHKLPDEVQVREARGRVRRDGQGHWPPLSCARSTEEELDGKLREAKIELFNLRFQAATGQLDSNGRLRAVRKEIARIYTVMRERELGIVTAGRRTRMSETRHE